jgi:ABC-type lipoprotein export system ATPase subunit/GNAT superfamily N-acetyltransferase
MPVINIVNQTKTKDVHPRMQMLSGIFDCPVEEINSFEIHDSIDIESWEWNIGLILGPSGCGKSSVLNQMCGQEKQYLWDDVSVITSFSKDNSISDICEALNSVGFGNIKAWMRPYHVLSNGEKFRASVARTMLESEGTIVIDEFTSVVDRQVAQIASHAIQKMIRKKNKQMIVASCHYDIIDWLQPDWTYEPHVKKFTRRLLRRRPDISIDICETNHSSWKIFSPYHYMSANLHKSAKCYALFCNDNVAAFAGILHRPISVKGERIPIWGVSRLVTLPDYQGLGLAFILLECIGEKYNKEGKRLRTYPAHPILVKSFDKSKRWMCKKKYGQYSSSSSLRKSVGGRPCAVYEYLPE